MPGTTATEVARIAKWGQQKRRKLTSFAPETSMPLGSGLILTCHRRSERADAGGVASRHANRPSASLSPQLQVPAAESRRCHAARPLNLPACAPSGGGYTDG